MAILSLGLLACSKKESHVENVYSPEEINKMIAAAELQDDKTPEGAIVFSDYSLGVKKGSSRSLVYKNLNFYVIEFENFKQAQSEAVRLNQYHSRNWLLDKVSNEPVLEELVKTKFHAIKY
jgi:hypothetical protein